MYRLGRKGHSTRKGSRLRGNPVHTGINTDQNLIPKLLLSASRTKHCLLVYHSPFLLTFHIRKNIPLSVTHKRPRRPLPQGICREVLAPALGAGALRGKKHSTNPSFSTASLTQSTGPGCLGTARRSLSWRDFSSGVTHLFRQLCDEVGPALDFVNKCRTLGGRPFLRREKVARAIVGEQARPHENFLQPLKALRRN